jgi:hypothetical protein
MLTASWQVKIALLFSVWYSLGRFSMGLGSKMSQGLILMDAPSFAYWEKKEKEKEKEKRCGWGLFSQGQRPDTPYWLC